MEKHVYTQCCECARSGCSGQHGRRAMQFTIHYRSRCRVRSVIRYRTASIYVCFARSALSGTCVPLITCICWRFLRRRRRLWQMVEVRSSSCIHVCRGCTTVRACCKCLLGCCILNEQGFNATQCSVRSYIIQKCVFISLESFSHTHSLYLTLSYRAAKRPT